jgi:catalase-peroxidase
LTGRQATGRFSSVKRRARFVLVHSGVHLLTSLRFSWHCAGSYRQTDGLGGCAGGRQRFDPEFSWDDNTNLDKAKLLLWPVKEKYGAGLSWGDLIILAGKVAIESGGFPWIPFCAGRPDQEDGSQSELLGPTRDQENRIPCAENGDCAYPFGADTIGLIYVNPEGFQGDYKNLGSTAALINQTFGFMSMDAEQTVALIGGGHAFGKTHGACTIDQSKFLPPNKDPSDPWPIDICSNGTFTTGFEGYWTSTPSKWSNQFFQRLVGNKFKAQLAPGGKYQYVTSEPARMMLPSDISLMTDPLYESYVRAFAKNASYLTDVFGAAWYKLTTRDMGPISRCLNVSIGGKWQLPPARDFQYPLPAPPTSLPNFATVAGAVRQVLYGPPTSVPAGFAGDYISSNKQAYWGALFAYSAFQCAATFRSTDHLGGCNGGRIRLDPQASWLYNNGVETVFDVLQPVYDSFNSGSTQLTWADLLVLAGSVAIEDATGMQVPFCGGRSDATSSYPHGVLQPGFNFSETTFSFKWQARVRGLEVDELIALAARPRSANQMARIGYLNATWTESLSVVSNAYFVLLLNETWKAVQGPAGVQYAAGELVLTPSDMQILWMPDLRNIAQQFASDNSLFLSKFVSAWTKLMNADRYGECGN